MQKASYEVSEISRLPATGNGERKGLKLSLVWRRHAA
jgi:hypothetical protein